MILTQRSVAYGIDSFCSEEWICEEGRGAGRCRTSCPGCVLMPRAGKHTGVDCCKTILRTASVKGKGPRRPLSASSDISLPHKSVTISRTKRRALLLHCFRSRSAVLAST